MAQRLRTLLVLGEIRGAVDSFAQVLRKLTETDADAITIVGDLGAPWSKPASYRSMFKALGQAGRPAYWVPGRWDGPLRAYLSESSSMETVYPSLHGVHGTAVLGPGEVLFAGMGGEIVDDPHAISEDEVRIRYPGWEVEYRLKVIRSFDQDQKIFLFTTRPAHKGLKEPGSQVLAELINTYRPKLAVVGGDHPMQELLGTTLVVCPGRVEAGAYALVQLPARTVSFRRLINVGEERLFGYSFPREPENVALGTRIRRLLHDTFDELGTSGASGRGKPWSPHTDFAERGDSYIVRMELPGVKREQVNIELVDNQLSIGGEIEADAVPRGILRAGTRRTGAFEHRVTFPGQIDADGIEARLADGVLEVQAPKLGAERLPALS
jgi:HSP20 family molecular chaperone IbpA/Icc-related predicted phosphoesterase